MALNCVVPCARREYDGDKVVLGGPDVDVPMLPELVARGVVPFRFMLDREDFGDRFLGCDGPEDVREVLLSEGYFPVPEAPWKDAHLKKRKKVQARVRSRRSRH